MNEDILFEISMQMSYRQLVQFQRISQICLKIVKRVNDIQLLQNEDKILEELNIKTLSFKLYYSLDHCDLSKVMVILSGAYRPIWVNGYVIINYSRNKFIEVLNCKTLLECRYHICAFINCFLKNGIDIGDLLKTPITRRFHISNLSQPLLYNSKLRISIRKYLNILGYSVSCYSSVPELNTDVVGFVLKILKERKIIEDYVSLVKTFPSVFK